MTNQMDLPSPPRGSKPARDGGSAFLCSLCDLDQVHKISQLLLPSLALSPVWIAPPVTSSAALPPSLSMCAMTWWMIKTREDKAYDFIQEMETNGFWRADCWVTLAETLLRNLDYDNIYHYGMGLQVQACKHDSVRPFKILLCKQNFGQSIIRREMDRHCITVCTMKLVNCPFYQVGCRTDAFPQLTSPSFPLSPHTCT
ncbi:hypothetical protein Taro_027252 [Colocasia esculenta]|uniref:TRAF-type domain-containing protein n=1 Tax=Colocasia esculenta TaxID=4460 RepID=A0A843VDH0_COLES|nr:hypothetical protein [Colocasia esculenta]